MKEYSNVENAEILLAMQTKKGNIFPQLIPESKTKITQIQEPSKYLLHYTTTNSDNRLDVQYPNTEEDSSILLETPNSPRKRKAPIASETYTKDLHKQLFITMYDNLNTKEVKGNIVQTYDWCIITDIMNKMGYKYSKEKFKSLCESIWKAIFKGKDPIKITRREEIRDISKMSGEEVVYEILNHMEENGYNFNKRMRESKREKEMKDLPHNNENSVVGEVQRKKHTKEEKEYLTALSAENLSYHEISLELSKRFLDRKFTKRGVKEWNKRIFNARKADIYEDADRVVKELMSTWITTGEEVIGTEILSPFDIDVILG